MTPITGPATEPGEAGAPTSTTIRLHTVDAAIDRARAIARRRRREPAGVVDEFIAERREDAAREYAAQTASAAKESEP